MQRVFYVGAGVLIPTARPIGRLLGFLFEALGPGRGTWVLGRTSGLHPGRGARCLRVRTASWEGRRTEIV